MHLRHPRRRHCPSSESPVSPFVQQNTGSVTRGCRHFSACAYRNGPWTRILHSSGLEPSTHISFLAQPCITHVPSPIASTEPHLSSCSSHLRDPCRRCDYLVAAHSSLHGFVGHCLRKLKCNSFSIPTISKLPYLSAHRDGQLPLLHFFASLHIFKYIARLYHNPEELNHFNVR